MIERLKKLNQLFNKRTKVIFWLLVFGMFIGSLLELLGIGAIPAFLHVMAEPKVVLQWPVLGGILKNIGITEPDTIFTFCALGLLVIYLLKNTYLSLLYYYKSKFVVNKRVELGKKLFTRYMLAPFIFHLNRNTAEMLRNVCVEVRILCLEVLNPLLQILLNTIMVIAIVTFLIVIKPIVSLVLLATLGFACFIFLRVTRSGVEKYGRQEQHQRKVEYQTVSEGLGGFKEARIFNSELFFIGNYFQSSKKSATARLFKSVSGFLSRPVMEFFAVSGIILLIILLRRPGGNLSSIIPTLSLFVVAILKLQTNLTQLASNFTIVKYNLYAVDPVYDDIYGLENEIAETFLNTKNIQPLRFKNDIKVKALSYKYPGAKENVLKDINLVIKKNSSVGFVGPTGSGKTTLINLIMGFIPPDKGLITVDEQNIWNHLKNWQQNIGFIPQHIYLADHTIKYNIAFGRHDDKIHSSRLRKALEIAHLDEFVFGLEKGWDTVIGENGIRMSGGQRQRLGIARAVYGNPKVLVMDEATSSLDNTTEAKVMEAIQVAGKGRTKIMIAHRLNTVRNCDKIFFLKDGKIKDFGSFEQLVKSSDEFREMSRQEN